MHIRQIIVAIVASVVGAATTLTLGTTSAHAATADECQALLTDLRQDTVDASASFVNAKDAANAVDKVDLAAAKLVEGKNPDSVAKLLDYQSKLAALAGAPKPKVDAATASSLTTEAQAAIDCIVALG